MLLVCVLQSTTFGLLICFDCEFPEPARCLALRGCDVVLAVAACAGAMDKIHICVQVRAMENLMHFLYVNHPRHPGAADGAAAGAAAGAGAGARADGDDGAAAVTTAPAAASASAGAASTADVMAMGFTGTKSEPAIPATDDAIARRIVMRGGSFAAGPDGNPVATLSQEPQVQVFTVGSKAKYAAHCHRNPYLRSRRPALYTEVTRLPAERKAAVPARGPTATQRAEAEGLAKAKAALALS